jgi:hypothetical protein
MKVPIAPPISGTIAASGPGVDGFGSDGHAPRVWQQALWGLAAAALVAVMFAVWFFSRNSPDTAQARPDAEVSDGGPKAAAQSDTPPSPESDGPEEAADASNRVPSPDGKAESPVSAAKPATATLATAALPPSTGLYMLRTDPQRTLLVTKLGGTVESEGAVAEGLNWLARHQARDGHWSHDCLAAQPAGCCEKDHGCSGPGTTCAMAHTGLSLLAFQAGGHYYFNAAKYSENVKKGLDWVVSHQQPGGALVDSLNRTGGFNNHYMYEHGMAAFALLEACAVAQASGTHPDTRYFQAGKRAVHFIEQQQHTDGGWRYTPQAFQASDTSVSGWQVLALKTAREAKIAVHQGCLDKCEQFFKSCERPDGRTAYQKAGSFNTEATTGVGMLVHEFLLRKPDSPLVKLAAPYLAGYAERTWGDGQPARPVTVVKGRGLKKRVWRGDIDYYLWYNCTLAMYQAGGDAWERWNDLVRDRLEDLQIHEGCARGSWDPADRWGTAGGGRIYSTALAALTLEVYYRFAKETRP